MIGPEDIEERGHNDEVDPNHCHNSGRDDPLQTGKRNQASQGSHAFTERLPAGSAYIGQRGGETRLDQGNRAGHNSLSRASEGRMPGSSCERSNRSQQSIEEGRLCCRGCERGSGRAGCSIDSGIVGRFAAPALPESNQASQTVDSGQHHERNNSSIVMEDAAIDLIIATQQIHSQAKEATQQPFWSQQDEESGTAKEVCQVVEAIDSNIGSEG